VCGRNVFIKWEGRARVTVRGSVLVRLVSQGLASLDKDLGALASVMGPLNVLQHDNGML
jgi:hypothetical protein